MANLTFINIGLPSSGRLIFRNIHDLDVSAVVAVSAGGSRPGQKYYPAWWPERKKRATAADRVRERILATAEKWADGPYVPPRMELLADLKTAVESSGETFQRDYYTELTKVLEDLRNKQALANPENRAIIARRNKNAAIAMLLLEL